MLAHLAYLFRHAVNTDEPQHLHVAWGWAHGLLPYRDVFDNHAPLFSLIMSPLVAWIGERADIVPAMRVAMLPLTAAALWGAWRIARALYSRPVAFWAVALTLGCPAFLMVSVEYRSDQLWAALWMLALAVLLVGRFDKARAFAAGTLIGASFAASMKTSLLLGSLLAAAAVTFALPGRRARLPSLGALLSRGASFVLGLALVPAVFALLFAAWGAWGELVYGTVGHNLVPGLWEGPRWRPWLGLALVPLLCLVAHQLLIHAPDPGRGARRSVLLLTAGFYAIGVACFWPLVTHQDWLPLVPAAAVLVAAGLVRLGRVFPREGATARLAGLAPAVVVGSGVAWALASEPPWRDGTVPEHRFLSDVLTLTRPGEYVMDLKGETIFRPRPYYFALEEVTRARLQRGLLTDDIPERLRSTGTRVAISESARFPERARGYLDSAYVSVGWLRVLGCMLSWGTEENATRTFAVRVPERYALLHGKSPAQGRLDGLPYVGPRWLSRGQHTYVAAPGERQVAVLWARAAELGFAPGVE